MSNIYLKLLLRKSDVLKTSKLKLQSFWGATTHADVI